MRERGGGGGGGGEGGRRGEGGIEAGVEEKEKGHTINELCIIVIAGFKFIMFYHILFHLERRDRVQSK